MSLRDRSSRVTWLCGHQLVLPPGETFPQNVAAGGIVAVYVHDAARSPQNYAKSLPVEQEVCQNKDNNY